VDKLGSVLVVGGSLVGLSVALATSRQGSHVTVVERSAGGTVSGGGLGVDVSLPQQVTGLSSAPPVYGGPDRDTTAWHLLRQWLEVACSEDPLIRLHHDADVVGVNSDSGTEVVSSADGRQWTGDFVVGADGVHSTIRRFVDPSRPSARLRRLHALAGDGARGGSDRRDRATRTG
jgi:2-polyprenyl-6-methoxyphenol hydroxylase-like FAD-dependent oxidoreductase